MRTSIDQAYFAHRALEETESGIQAANATTAAIHFELAYRYSLLAADTPRARPVLTLVSSRQFAA